MKKHKILKTLVSAVMLFAGGLFAQAANGIIETQVYTICPGDELSLDGRITVITQDTILYDTISVTAPWMDSIYVFVVNTYPALYHKETRTLEVGSSFVWHNQTISKPGEYQDINKNRYGCDSAYYLTVQERLPETVYYSVTDTTICEGDYIIWDGIKYTSSDVVYKVKYGAAGGRDSVYILHLTVHPISRKTEMVEFTNWPANYRDSVLKEPGAYEFRYIGKSGCDSIITVIANQQVIMTEASATICEGEKFEWRGTEYSESGQYQTIIKTKNGKHDSIYHRLTLTVLPVKRSYITRSICRGGEIIFGGRKCDTTGVYYDTIKTSGCDSIVQMSLQVMDADSTVEVHQMLDGETFEWNGKTYTEAGIYYYRTTNKNGCDSIVKLVLTQKHVARFDTTVYRCEGETFTWHGMVGRETFDYTKIDESGDETTVYTLHMIIGKPSHTWEEIQADDFPITYRGWTFTEAGSHDFKYLTSKGCDSIVTVVANKRMIVVEESATICPGTEYVWRYQHLKESGIYQEIEKTKDGTKDSIYHVLNLTVRYIPTTYVNATICQGDSYSFGGMTYYEEGLYTHTFKIDGCDSMVVLSLNARTKDTILHVRQIQEKDLPMTWGGHYWSSAGIYDEVDVNRFGCDSISRYILTTHHVDTVDTTATICHGETLVWHGITGRDTYQYTNIETQPNGDQVVYRLNLTVREMKVVDKYLKMCAGSEVTFNGKSYTKAGTYLDRYNCDTTYRVVVTIEPASVFVTNAVMTGNSYTWEYGGKTKNISTPGTYTEEIKNEETGCTDIYRLILAKDNISYNFEESLTVCEGEDFVWRGRSGLSQQGVGQTSDYKDEYKTVAGKDSIYTLHLTVLPLKRSTRTIQFCEQIEWRGKTYTESGVVYDTIASSTSCDSIVKIYLDKSPRYLFHDTATIVQGEILTWFDLQINKDGLYRKTFKTVAGCDSIYELGVGIIAATPQTPTYTTLQSICEGDVFTWRNRDYTTSGTYVDSVFQTGPQNRDSIFVLKLTVWPTYSDTIVQHLYSCGGEGTIRYNGVEYTKDTALINVYKTYHNCDSVVKTFLHFNTESFKSDTLRIADNDTTRIWHDQKINHSGTFRYEEKVDVAGECYHKEELVVFMYKTFLYVKDTAICQNEAPYEWKDGPADKQDERYAHTPGETKTYEYKYMTVDGVDSIYRLNLTIYPSYIVRQQLHLCEGDVLPLNGKQYYNLVSDSVYRDTTILRTQNNCDSIIYTEIIQHPKKEITITKTLVEGDTIFWEGDTITRPGQYVHTDPQAINGCDSIRHLNVIHEQVWEDVICMLDTPYLWRGKEYFTTGSWKDTVPDAYGNIAQLWRLDLTVTTPPDTTIYLYGCQKTGVTWRGETFLEDTIVEKRVPVEPFNPLNPCDTVYKVVITIDTVYLIEIDTTLCETELPFILGRQNPDTLWEEHVNWIEHTDTTFRCGCDSTIRLKLRITPTLTKSDSTFICENEIKEHPIYLGDTVTPWFEYRENGKFKNAWRGKWHGIPYHTDTTVWDCDHTYFHRIIVRPSQKVPKDTTYYLCEGDSVQLFWPKTQWIKKDTVYFDTVPMNYEWTNKHHGISYNSQDYTCDSVTRWTVKYVHPEFKEKTQHILLGDSVWWGGAWRYYTGDYDSIGTAKEKNSDSIPCRLEYKLHLIADTAYFFRDTVDVCAPARKTLSHIWEETGHQQSFIVPKKDSSLHYYDSLKTIDRRDSIYDLFVNYRLIPTTHLYDTICEGDSLRFDKHSHTVEQHEERHLTKAGIYYDTIPGTNICDSVLIMHLYVLNRVPVTHRRDMVTDRELPYIWEHPIVNAGGVKDTLRDTLFVTGEYSRRLENKFGCDSIDSLSLTVHQTHVFRDTIEVCATSSSTLTHVWETGHKQRFNVVEKDSSIHYFDTLQTRIKLDSIYDLYVHFHTIQRTRISRMICEGDSMRFGLTKSNVERFISKSGVYYDTLRSNSNGCDSIIELTLNVYPKFLQHKKVDIADIDTPYIWEHPIVKAGGVKETLRDTLYASGEYRRVLESTFGCDSIDSLSLYIHKTYLFKDTITICQSETPYTWKGEDGTIFKKGIYETETFTMRLQTKDGYDSTYVRHIIVLPIKQTTIHRAICEGDSIRFGLTKSNKERYVSTQGTHQDTLITEQGCDSIVTMILSVYPKHVTHKTVDIADVDTPYVWEHVKWICGMGHLTSDSLYAPGEYTYRMESEFGCDSIDSLSLRIHKTYKFVEEITICERQTPYTWHDRNDITTDGTYYFNPRTKDGYDSIYIATIHITPTKRTTIRESICENNLPFIFGGSELWKGGQYIDSLASQNGCDSIVTLILTVNKPYYHFERKDIYDNETYTFFGQTYATSGTYFHNSTTPDGCDSISELLLVVHPLVDTLATVCSTALPFEWVNKWSGDTTLLYSPGLYHDTTIVNGETTFWSIQLAVTKPAYKEIQHKMCEGSTYTFKGLTLTQSGIYRDTLTAVNGCDSIVTLTLIVNKPYYHVEKIDILQGQSYTFYGTDYNTTGIYPHYNSTPEGCDSTTILQLTVHQLVDTIMSRCSNELPLIWYNKWSGKEERYYTAGTYRNDTTIDGRKHFYGFQLIVNDPTFKEIQHKMCEGSTYTFKGLALTQSGIYRDTLTAVNGCDSIVTLTLIVNKPYYHVEKIDILQGQSYTFYGTDYTKTGTFTHYSSTPEGCDSTTILQLTVHQLVDTTVTICSSELPYRWVNKWTGETTLLYHAGLYRNDTTYVNGQKMFYGLQLNVNAPSDTTIYRSICEGSYFQFNGQNLINQGEYRDTLKNISGCDSIVRLLLTIHPTFHNVISRTIFEGDTVHFENKIYNQTGRYPFRYTTQSGCDSIIELNLIVRKLYDDSISICFNDLPLIWRNKEIYQSGVFRDTTYDSEGTQVISGLRVLVLPTYRAPEPIVQSICEGDFFNFNGKNLTQSGTYYDTLTAINGCDSIISLSLQVIPQYTQELTKLIYEGDSVFFNGEWRKESGIYEYTVKNTAGCMDTYRMVVTVLKQFHIDTTAYVCKNDLPFVWHGLSYNESGDYSVPTSWTDSSRVMTTLHLFINESYYYERNISLCEGSTYIYKNREFTQSGFFYDTIPSMNGCDSICKFIVSVHPSYDRIDTVHISDKQSYNFNGRELNQSGYYEASGSTIHGCDSMIHLVLIVHPSYYNFDSINLCQGDTLQWHGQKIFKSGLYSDSLLTETYNFDSVYQVRVVVQPKYFIEQQYEITEGYPTFIHGINISKPGVYYDSLYTIHGCDSVYQIVVNWARKFTQHQSVTICQGDYYEFFGMRLTHAGEYDHTSLKGDSTIYLTLTVNPTSVSETRIVISPEDLPYIYNERTYAEGGIYADTFHNRYHCDSVARLVLVVSEHASAWEQIPLCPGQELKIEGEIINKAGLYTFIKRSKVSGLLDSLYRVEVFDAPDFESAIDSIVICEGDSVTFAGKKVWRGGLHTANLKTKNGCDSILHMHLTVNPSYLYPTSATITDYQSYIWRGKEYTKQGVYEQSYPTIKDCDSTYQLNLTVIETQRIVINDSICYRDTLRWRDHLLTSPGTYSDTICNLASHTSIIYTLNLGVVTPTIITSATVTETAADVESFLIHFTYSGLRPNTYSIQFDELAHAEGFTDIVNKPFGVDIVAEVPMPHKTQVIYQEHTAYVRPNYYTMRLALDNSVCGISRSDSLSLLIRYPSWILEQNWDDVVAPLRSEYNGGYEFGAYTWYVNDAVFPNDGLPYLQSKSLKPGDKVELYATRIGESYAIPTAPLTITAPIPNVTQYPVLVYPTATSKLHPCVTIEAQNRGTYKVYSSTGKLFSTGEFERGESPIELPSVSGCCLIQATSEDGYILTQKIIIY